MLRQLAFWIKPKPSSICSSACLPRVISKHLNTSCRFNATDKHSNTSEELVAVERAGDVTLIAINRPQKRNCVDILTAKALLKAFRQFETDPQAKVAVLYGKG